MTVRHRGSAFLLTVGMAGATAMLGACASSNSSGSAVTAAVTAAVTSPATGLTTVPTTVPVTPESTLTSTAGPTTPADTTAPGTTAPGTTAPGTTAPGTTAPGTTDTTSTPATTGVAAPMARCHASDLSASLGRGEGAAGSTYTPLVVRNIGTSTCLLAGRPGVSLLDAAGIQIGQPAEKDVTDSPKTNVELQPGAAASAVLHTTNGPIGGPCTAPSAQIKVYPPNEFDAIVFPAVYTACGGFSVRPFVPGTTGL